MRYEISSSGASLTKRGFLLKNYRTVSVGIWDSMPKDKQRRSLEIAENFMEKIS